MKIGVGITTRNRKKVFMHSLRKHALYAPNNAKYVVVDDGSDEADIPSDFSYRFTFNVGVATAKNKCLELLEDCDHIFLFDDDTHPIAEEWWKPYLESKEPHLMYQFKLPGKPSSDMRVEYEDDNIVSYTHTRGAMLYIERKVLDVVGGFDTRYRNGFEHPDWTNRIHNAGLTTYRAMDVPGSGELFYCFDQKNEVISTIDNGKRSHNENIMLYKHSRFSKEFKEYK